MNLLAWPVRYVAVATAILLAMACASEPNASRETPSLSSPFSSAEEERDRAVMQVLDRYMTALNALDLEGHVATYHFPHYRHASAKIVIWQTPLEAIPLLAGDPTTRRAALRGALEPEWDRSEWTRREIVQADAAKVHVVTRFDRLRADGSVIKSFDSLYVLTKESGRWGIKGRSSFAP